jgi:hypothetical protein
VPNRIKERRKNNFGFAAQKWLSTPNNTKRGQANAFIGRWPLAKNKLMCQRRFGNQDLTVELVLSQLLVPFLRGLKNHR